MNRRSFLKTMAAVVGAVTLPSGAVIKVAGGMTTTHLQPSIGTTAEHDWLQEEIDNNPIGVSLWHSVDLDVWEQFDRDFAIACAEKMDAEMMAGIFKRYG